MVKMKKENIVNSKCKFGTRKKGTWCKNKLGLLGEKINGAPIKINGVISLLTQKFTSEVCSTEIMTY